MHAEQSKSPRLIEPRLIEPRLIEEAARWVACNVAALVENQPVHQIRPPPPHGAEDGFSSGPWQGRLLNCHRYLREHAATLNPSRDVESATGR
jgi:hypothetical protein